MTYDQLDKKILDIKKKGLAKVVELDQIRKVKGEYYSIQNEKTQDVISKRLYKNIMFLSNKFKSYPSPNNIKQFMGISLSDSFESFMKEQSSFFLMKDAIIVAEYYGVPVNLLLFDDIEIYGEQLWKEYNTFHKSG